MFLRASVLVATAITLSAVLAGCGDDTEAPAKAGGDAPAASESAAAEKPEARLLTAEQAKAALPTAADLPGSGWKTAPADPDESHPTVTPASCSPVMNEISTDFLGYKSKLAAKQNVTFNNEASRRAVLFEVASWTNEADSALPLAAAKLADKCKSFTAAEEGVELAFTAETLTPLPIGEERTAVRLTAAYQGTKVHLTVYQAKIGHNLVSMVQTSSDAADHSSEYQPALEGIVADLKA